MGHAMEWSSSPLNWIKRQQALYSMLRDTPHQRHFDHSPECVIHHMKIMPYSVPACHSCLVLINLQMGMLKIFLLKDYFIYSRVICKVRKTQHQNPEFGHT
jgi:hypothetical protein